MNTYQVSLHEEAGDKFTIVFTCIAVDECDAEDKALQEYPQATIVHILNLDRTL